MRMLFKNGKRKVLLISYDDGVTQDRKFIDLLNRYNLKGTFNLNSGKLNGEYNVTSKEVNELYKGHEVAIHTVNHPYLETLNEDQVINEIIEDQKVLSNLVGYHVRGMAYPFGTYSKEVINVLQKLDIVYSRTVKNIEDFQVPNNFLTFHPTTHHNNQNLFDLFDVFYKSNDSYVFTLWGHTWEFGTIEEWDRIEMFFSKVYEKEDIFSTTMIDFCNYVKAYNQLIIKEGEVINPTNIDLWLLIDEKVIKIDSGNSFTIKKNNSHI